MRIEIALDVQNGVGEGPFWDDRAGELWWVDITEGDPRLAAGRSGAAALAHARLPLGGRPARGGRCPGGAARRPLLLRSRDRRPEELLAFFPHRDRDIDPPIALVH